MLELDHSSNHEVLELSEEMVEEKDEESSLLSRNIFILDRFEENLRQNLQKAIEEIKLNRFEETEKREKNNFLIEEEKSLSSSNEHEISEKQESSLKHEEKEKVEGKQ